MTSASSETPKPTLSIVISNYRNANGVKSLLEDTPPDLRSSVEYVVVDDHSGDSDREIIEKAARDYPLVQTLFHPRNAGVLATQKTGVEKARGTYLCFRGSDDRHLEGFWKTVRQHVMPQTAYIICGDIVKQVVGSKQHTNVSNKWTPNDDATFLSPDQFATICGEKQIWGQTVIVKRESYLEFGGFAKDLAWASDLILFQSIAFAKGILIVAEPLVLVEVSRNSFSARGMAGASQDSPVQKAIIREVLKNNTEVLARYASSGWLGRFGPPLAHCYQSHPELWSSQGNVLLERNLYLLNKERDASRNRCYDASKIEEVLKTLSVRCQTNQPDNIRFCLYGAGDIARKIIQSWHNYPLPPIEKIVTSDTSPQTSGIHGIPVVPLTKASLSSYDFIIIASKVFEKEILEICLEHTSKDKIITIYNEQ